MKLKHLRDALERLKDADDELEVVFGDKPRADEEGVLFEAHKLAAVMQQGDFVALVTQSVVQMISKDVSDSTSKGIGTSDIIIDSDLGMVGIEYRVKKPGKEDSK